MMSKVSDSPHQIITDLRAGRGIAHDESLLHKISPLEIRFLGQAVGTR